MCVRTYIVLDEVSEILSRSSTEHCEGCQITRRFVKDTKPEMYKKIKSGKIHDFYVITNQTPGEKLDITYRSISLPFYKKLSLQSVSYLTTSFRDKNL
jgi:hypothetical protein